MSFSCISFLRCRPFMALMTRRLLWPLKAIHLTRQKKYELLKEHQNGLLPGGFHGDILTISWKDVVAESSYKELVTFKELKKKGFQVIFSWTLLGGIMLHSVFKRMTTKKGGNKGKDWDPLAASLHCVCPSTTVVIESYVYKCM